MLVKPRISKQSSSVQSGLVSSNQMFIVSIMLALALFLVKMEKSLKHDQVGVGPKSVFNEMIAVIECIV